MSHSLPQAPLVNLSRQFDPSVRMDDPLIDLHTYIPKVRGPLASDRVSTMTDEKYQERFDRAGATGSLTAP